MRVACHLRQIRGTRTMREIIAAADGFDVKITEATISEVERGLRLPADPLIPALEHAYGAAVTDWYDGRTLLALQADEETA